MRGDTGLGRDALGTGQASAAQVQEASPLPGLHGHFQAPRPPLSPRGPLLIPAGPVTSSPCPSRPFSLARRAAEPQAALRPFPPVPLPAWPFGAAKTRSQPGHPHPSPAVHTDPTVLSHVCNTQTRTRSCTHALTHAPYMRTHHTDTKHTCAHAHACTHACANIHMHALAHRHTYMYTHLRAGTHADRVTRVHMCYMYAGDVLTHVLTCMQERSCTHKHTQTRSRTCMLTHMQTHTCSQTQRTMLTHSHSQTRAHT